MNQSGVPVERFATGVTRYAMSYTKSIIRMDDWTAMDHFLVGVILTSDEVGYEGSSREMACA